MLKAELKLGQRTPAGGKDGPQMFHGLQQRIHLPADRWRLFPAQSCPYPVQAPQQTAPQTIDRFQGKGQPQFFRGGLERKPRQQFHQPGPHQRSAQRVSWQNVGQEDGKGSPAATPLAAIGTKHPLAPERFAVRGLGIVAQRPAVPVQTANAAAMRTRRLLEGKSCDFNSSSSRTK